MTNLSPLQEPVAEGFLGPWEVTSWQLPRLHIVLLLAGDIAEVTPESGGLLSRQLLMDDSLRLSDRTQIHV